jgi:hypothetical protein
MNQDKKSPDLNSKRDPGRAVIPDTKLKGQGMQDEAGPGGAERGGPGRGEISSDSSLSVDDEMDETSIEDSAEEGDDHQGKRSA